MSQANRTANDRRACPNQAFRYVPTGIFTAQGEASAGELRLVQANATTWVIEGDTDGDGAVDLIIFIPDTRVMDHRHISLSGSEA